jgi:hypothetical protein
MMASQVRLHPATGCRLRATGGVPSGPLIQAIGSAASGDHYAAPRVVLLACRLAFDIMAAVLPRTGGGMAYVRNATRAVEKTLLGLLLLTHAASRPALFSL